MQKIIPYLFSFFNSCLRIKVPGEKELYLFGLDNMPAPPQQRLLERGSFLTSIFPKKVRNKEDAPQFGFYEEWRGDAGETKN